MLLADHYNRKSSLNISHERLYGNTSDDLCHADCEIFVDEESFNNRSFWYQYDWSAESYYQEGIIVPQDKNQQSSIVWGDNRVVMFGDNNQDSSNVSGGNNQERSVVWGSNNQKSNVVSGITRIVVVFEEIIIKTVLLFEEMIIMEVLLFEDIIIRRVVQFQWIIRRIVLFEEIIRGYFCLRR